MGQDLLPIVASSLAIGLAAGFVMHRADFCITASFLDMFLMRQMVLLVVVSMVLFESGRLAGLITIHPFPLQGAPTLAVQSLLFVAGLLPGTWVGARLLTRFVIR